jgi:hypothetical protein
MEIQKRFLGICSEGTENSKKIANKMKNKEE